MRNEKLIAKLKEIRKELWHQVRATQGSESAYAKGQFNAYFEAWELVDKVITELEESEQ